MIFTYFVKSNTPRQSLCMAERSYHLSTGFVWPHPDTYSLNDNTLSSPEVVVPYPATLIHHIPVCVSLVDDPDLMPHALSIQEPVYVWNKLHHLFIAVPEWYNHRQLMLRLSITLIQLLLASFIQ